MSYKVALLGPKGWALGSINLHLKKNLGAAGHDVRNVDWRKIEDVYKAIDWCDVFIAEVHVFERIGQHMPDKLKKKGMYVWHHLAEIPGFKLDDKKHHHHFATKIPVDKELINNFYAITKDTKDSVDQYYGLNVNLLPVGVDDDFWSKRSDQGPIKKIGCVMSPEDKRPQYNAVKRYDMFSEIGEKAGLEYDYCFGKTIHTGSYIYDGFDVIVNTSTHEGLPTPLLECAAAKVPFISTKVGIVPQYSSIKTFDTVEEAVEILNELNSDPKILKKYVEDVYEDVAMSNLWSEHIKNYYEPAFERITSDKEEEKQPPCYIVLGMHRSSTSMVSRVMHESGEVFMGKRMFPGVFGNEKGHWENADFLDINERMFDELGGFWDNPPTLDQLRAIFPKYKDEMKRVVDQAIEDMKEAGFKSWGFKDPRTCITLPLWLEFIDNPRIVAMKRDSKEIAESLYNRNRIPFKKGLKLAKIYNDAIDSYDIWK